MKKLIWIPLFLPFFGMAQFKIVNISTTNLLELRADTWPINLQKVTKASDTSYVLSFRTQEYTNAKIMKTLRFSSLEQLKYFQKGLSTLRTGNTGDVAEFRDYTIKRVDLTKKEGIWYTLTFDGGLTNFQQSEADQMIAAINKL
jgi:hypothetical protein